MCYPIKMHQRNHLGENWLPEHCNRLHSFVPILNTHTSFRTLNGSALPPITYIESPKMLDVWPIRGHGAAPWTFTTWVFPLSPSSNNKSFRRACLPMPPKPPKMTITSWFKLSNVQALWPQRKSLSTGSPTTIMGEIGSCEDPVNYINIQTVLIVKAKHPAIKDI